jgi:hypothetical protein
MDVRFDDDASAAAAGAGDPSAPGESGSALGPDGEPVYVNEKTIAIDLARQAMISQQADFEARIKALTSFSTTAPPSKKPSSSTSTAGASSKRKTASAASGSAKDASSPTKLSPRPAAGRS